MIKFVLSFIFLLFTCPVIAAVTTTSCYPTADVYLDASATSTNRDTSGLQVRSHSTGTNDRVSILSFGLGGGGGECDVPVGSKIWGSYLEFTLSANVPGSATLGVYKMLRASDWSESQSTWSIYKTGSNWTTAGARGDGTDIFGTWGTGVSALSLMNVSTVNLANTKIGFDSSTAFKQYIQDNAAGNVYFAIHEYTNHLDLISMYDSENATATNRPRLIVVYSDTDTYPTWHTRTDGGTGRIDVSSIKTPPQCNGFYDAAYPGTGVYQDCAFNHPHWPMGNYGGLPKLMGASDKVIIHDNTFIGCVPAALDDYGTAGDCIDPTYNITTSAKCYSTWTTSCTMDSVISGIDSSHPTRIYGENAENGCATKTELYADRLLTSGIKLTDTNNAEIKCIELTDHSTNNVVPYVNGSLMSNGIYAEDSSSILLENVSIHGVRKGILAGRLSNWTLKSVDLLRNMSAGWDGDIGHTAPNDSNNSGDMIFNNVKIQYNGCNEIYPDNKPVFCASQSQGGYGDGLGTYKTGGNWYFTDCDFSHNTSDGLDLLYHTGDGNIYIKNSRFEGNAGNPLKLAALNDYVENSKVIANCGYFKDQSFTSTVHVTTGNPTGFDNCRAGAQALALILRENSQHKIYNSTILGDGGILFYTQGTGCNGTERVVARNNIYVGGPAFLDQTKDTDIFYAGGSDGDCGNPACCFSGQFDNDYAVEYGMKDPCQSTSNYFCESPDFIDTTDLGFYTGEEQNVGLQVTSPAIAEGNTSIVCTYGDCGEDFYHNDRASSWDLGALQYGSSSSSCTTVPSLCLDQYTCEVAGWNWWSTQVCMATAEPNPCASTCSECATQLACEGSAAGCYYYDSSCHATPQSTCDDDCSICSTDEQCTLSDVVGGCHWVVQGPGVGSCLAGPAGAEGENCDTNCLACVTQETCLASPLGCSYWTDGQCRNVSQNCDNDCSSCVTPATCSASLSHCIYYRDGSCNPENEPLESLGATTVNFSGGTLNGLNIR